MTELEQLRDTHPNFLLRVREVLDKVLADIHFLPTSTESLLRSVERELREIETEKGVQK